MEYTISFTFSRENYRDVNQVLWKEYFRGVATSYAVYSILPFIVLVVYGLSKDNPLALLCGVALFLFAVIKWIGLYRYKRRFFDNAEEIADRLEFGHGQITYAFTDEWLEYCDNEKKLGFSWKLYNDYHSTDNCIIIKFEGDTPSMVISRIDIGETAWEETQQLLEQKLSEKWAVLT